MEPVDTEPDSGENQSGVQELKTHEEPSNPNKNSETQSGSHGDNLRPQSVQGETQVIDKSQEIDGHGMQDAPDDSQVKTEVAAAADTSINNLEVIDGQSPATDEQSTVGKSSPSSKEETPTAEEQTPAAEEQTLALVEQTPADGDQTPADGDQTPADGEQTPADCEQTPADGEQTPTNGEQTPADGEQTPTQAEQVDRSISNADESSMDVDEVKIDEGDESRQSTDDNTAQKRTRITNSKLMLKSLPQGLAADSLFEYRWPQTDEHADYYVLQEQVCMYLDIKSFRRKYPDLERRQIDILERNYLMDIGVVTEMQCDLGLTALKSEDIADLMQADYPDKYQEYAKVQQKREEMRLAKKQQELQEQHNSTPQPRSQGPKSWVRKGPVSKLDIKKLTERAIKSAASYNAFLSRERREERRYYFDIQTGVVQCGRATPRAMPSGLTRPSPYPVSLIPGQYSSYYHQYSADELKYLPVKTALYNPPLRVDNPYRPLPPDTEQPPVQEELAGMNAMIPSTVDTSDITSAAPAAMRRMVTKLAAATCCLCGRVENRSGEEEKCIKCSQCHRETHPTCCELTSEMLSVVVTYSWMCMDCKVCVRCSDPGNEDKMIVCDKCDRGYHTFCVGLKSIPEESIWACPECVSSS